MATNELNIRINTEADKTPITDLSSAVQELQANADSASASMSELSSGVDEIGTASDSASTSLDDAATSADELSSSTSSIDSSGLDDAGTSADALGDSLDNAQTESDELSQSLGVIEGASLLGAAEQISGIASEAEGLSQEMNTASITVGQLATQTGIAEPQLRSMISYISNATFPQEDAMMYVKSLDQIGVSSGNLAQSAMDLDTINDAFGLGAGRVNSLSQELSVLGVDMNNVSSSFNALAYANSNTVGGMDNYYNFLRKYDAQFKELGFNVDQASVIIAAATHKFGGGKAALSGLNEALKESNGDTRALEQALGLQAGSIENATQLTGQYEGQLEALADEEAEHKTLTEQLGAVWEDMSLTFAPIISPLTSVIGLLGQVGSFAVGINGIITLLDTFGLTSKIAAAGQWLLNAAMSANPVMIVALAIAFLIGLLVYLYFNNEQVRNAVNNLGATFVAIGQIIYTTVANLVAWIISGLQQVWIYITTLGGLLPANVELTGNQIMDTIIRVLAFIATLPIQLQMIFINVLARALGFGNNFSQRMINGAMNAVNGFISWISSLPGRLAGELNKMLQMASDFAMKIANTLTGGAAGMVVGWITGSGEHSPGYMYDAFEGELKAMEDAPRRFNFDMGSVARNMVKSFGNPTFDFNTANDSVTGSNDNGQGTIVNLTLNVGSVDKRERVDEIIGVVRDYFMWNNTTAGRSV